MTNAQRKALEAIRDTAEHETDADVRNELYRMLVRERRQHAIEHDRGRNA